MLILKDEMKAHLVTNTEGGFKFTHRITGEVTNHSIDDFFFYELLECGAVKEKISIHEVAKMGDKWDGETKAITPFITALINGETKTVVFVKTPTNIKKDIADALKHLDNNGEILQKWISQPDTQIVNRRNEGGEVDKSTYFFSNGLVIVKYTDGNAVTIHQRQVETHRDTGTLLAWLTRFF